MQYYDDWETNKKLSIKSLMNPILYWQLYTIFHVQKKKMIG